MELWEESPTWTCRQRFNPRIGSAVPSWNFRVVSLKAYLRMEAASAGVKTHPRASHTHQ